MDAVPRSAGVHDSGRARRGFHFYPTDHAGAARSSVAADAAWSSVTCRRRGLRKRSAHRDSRSRLQQSAARAGRASTVARAHRRDVASIADNGGRSCVNASGVWMPRTRREIAEALAERAGQRSSRCPRIDPDALLAPFLDRRGRGMDQRADRDGTPRARRRRRHGRTAAVSPARRLRRVHVSAADGRLLRQPHAPPREPRVPVPIRRRGGARWREHVARAGAARAYAGVVGADRRSGAGRVPAPVAARRAAESRPHPDEPDRAGISRTRAISSTCCTPAARSSRPP